MNGKTFSDDVEMMLEANDRRSSRPGMSDQIENRIIEAKKSWEFTRLRGWHCYISLMTRLLTGIHDEDTIEQYHAHRRQFGRLLYQGALVDLQALMLRDSLQRWVASE
ncbi:hypothetical protein ACNKHT_20750 [Shigella flexneri]